MVCFLLLQTVQKGPIEIILVQASEWITDLQLRGADCILDNYRDCTSRVQQDGYISGRWLTSGMSLRKEELL